MPDPDNPPTTITKVPPGTDLEALLESLTRGGATAHATTARILLEAFHKATSLESKRLLAAEIFCKLIQSLEDLGAFCLFCLSGRTGDIRNYFAVKTRRIVEFYGRCREGLSDSEIHSIYGLPTIDDLLSSGEIALSHRHKYEYGLAKFRNLVNAEFRKRGTLFARYDENKKRYVHSDLVNMYFNAKHGTRVFLPTPTRAKSMNIADSHVSILIGTSEDAEGQNIGIEIGSFAMTGIPKMVDNVKFVCDHLESLAHIRLSTKKDPLFVFNAMREGTVDRGTVSGVAQIGRNDQCYCGSGKKFKKCHGRVG